MWQLSIYCLSCPNPLLIASSTTCLQTRAASHSHGYIPDFVIRNKCKSFIISVSYTLLSNLYLLSVHIQPPFDLHRDLQFNDPPPLRCLSPWDIFITLVIQSNSWLIIIISLTFTFDSLAPFLSSLYSFMKLRMG